MNKSPMSHSPFRLRRAERMQEKDILETYCPPPHLPPMDDARNIVLQGARGSGKSTVLKAITSPYRSTQLSVEGRLICGTYFTLGQSWVAGFQRRGWLAPERRLALFGYALNLAFARALCTSVQEILRTLPALRELEDEDVASACTIAAHFLADSTKPRSMIELTEELCTIDREVRSIPHRALFGENAQLPSAFIPGECFEPIQAAIHDLVEHWRSKLPDIRAPLWLFAIDELDNLDAEHQKLINTALRNARSPIVLKVACLPHGHRTLETLVPSNPLQVGDDFDYVALSPDPKSPEHIDFCRRVYSARRTLVSQGKSLPDDPRDWVGKTSLRERASTQLAKSSSEVSAWEDEVRAELGRDKQAALPFARPWMSKDSARQYVPALAMRQLRQRSSGHTSVAAYAGWDDVVASSDGNPRRLLRVLDRLFETGETSSIPEKHQSTIIQEIAGGVIDRLISLPQRGAAIQRLASAIGRRLERRLHSGELKVDACSVKFSLNDLPLDARAMLEAAIAYGVLCPWRFDARNGFPVGSHEYWLSFGIAPKFWLLLRPGDSVTIPTTELGPELFVGESR